MDQTKIAEKLQIIQDGINTEGDLINQIITALEGKSGSGNNLTWKQIASLPTVYAIEDTENTIRYLELPSKKCWILFYRGAGLYIYDTNDNNAFGNDLIEMSCTVIEESNTTYLQIATGWSDLFYTVIEQTINDNTNDSPNEEEKGICPSITLNFTASQWSMGMTEMYIDHLSYYSKGELKREIVDASSSISVNIDDTYTISNVDVDSLITLVVSAVHDPYMSNYSNNIIHYDGIESYGPSIILFSVNDTNPATATIEG